MAGGVEIATMKAVLDTSGMKQGAREGVASMDQLAKGAEKVDAAMQTVRASAVRMAGVLGAYQFSQWIKGNIDLAARYETLGVVIQQVSKAAGYASSDINRLTDALQKQGISMMQSRQSVISMIQAKLDLAKADQLAAVAQNAAVTAGLNSSATLQRIIYGITTAQTDVLRSVGIVTEFEGAYKKMAESLKKSVGDLTVAEKSQARVNAVIEAGKPIAGAYAASMDTAGKQTASMARYVEDLRLKLGQAFAPANTAMVFTMATAVKTLSDNSDKLIMVIGALIARSLLPIVDRFKEAGLVLAKNRAENAAYVEDMIRTANVQRVNAEKRLLDLKEEQAAIRAVALTERQRFAESTARVNRAVDPVTLAPLGGRVADRDNAEVAFAIKNQAEAQAQLNALGQRGAAVQAELVSANAAVAATTAQVAAAQQAAAAATSMWTKATTALGTVYNALGGWLGIALMAIAAFYTSYSAKMQRAKEEIDVNSDAIKKKLDEISEKRAQSFGGTFDGTETDNFNKKVIDLTNSVKRASENIRDTSVTFTEFWKDQFTNFGMFNVELERLLKSYERQEIGLTQLVSGIDTLSARYPNMADAAERAKERVALLAIKQDELNKFVKETPAPLMAAAAALDLWSLAARGASQIQTPKFIQANLGEKGRDAEREIANLQRMQSVIRTGNQASIRTEQDRQAAEKTAQALIDDRVKGNEKLVDVLGKTRQELAAMGPVANEAIAQLRADADATFENERRKQALVRANERLTGSMERQLQAQRQTRAFLQQSGGPSQNREESFNESVADYRRSMRDTQNAKATETAVAQAREYFRIQTVQLQVSEDMADWERDRLRTVDATLKKMQEQEKVMVKFRTIANALQSVNSELANQEAQLFAVRASKNGTFTRQQNEQIRQAQMLAQKTKEYRDIGLDAATAESKAQQFVKNQTELERLTKVTQNWRDSVKEVAQSFSQLSQVLQQAGNDNTRLLGVAGSALGSLMTTLDRLADIKTKKIQPNQMTGMQQVMTGIGGAISVFSQGYAFGTTTPNKAVGAAGGALTGAATGASIGSAFTPIGTLVGSVVGAAVGAIGGLVGADQKGKQVQTQLKLNAEKINSSLESIRSAFSNEGLNAAIAQARQQFVDLRKAAEDTYRGRANEPGRAQVIAEINRLEEIRVRLLREEFEAQLQLATRGLEARAARAAGLNEEADLIDAATARTEELNAAIKKYGADSTYVRKLQEVLSAENAAAAAARKKVEEQRQFENKVANDELLARALYASGNVELAEIIRQQSRNEEELRQARERNLDISLLLAAQEAEAAERKRVQLQNEARKDQDFFVRQTTLTNGGIAGQLASKINDITNRMNAATNQTDRNREFQIGMGEYNALRAQFRDQATSLMGGYANANILDPVVAAQTEATLRYGEAQQRLQEYLKAGIISHNEYNTALNNVTESNKRAVKAAEIQKERDRLSFMADLFGRQSEMNPLDRQAARKLFDIQGDAAYNDAYQNAVRLRDAGVISKDVFADFVEIITKQFSPAVRNAAWTLAETTRVMNQNLSAIQQQWSVFGTDAGTQVSDLSRIFGFEGKSIDQIRGMFNRVTPGQELSATQLQMNQNIATFMGAWQRWQDSQQQAGQLAGQQSVSFSPTSYTGPTVLDREETVVRAARSISEASAMSLQDIGQSQLSVQRDILAWLRNRGETENTTTASAGVNDRTLGDRISSSAMLVNGVIV